MSTYPSADEFITKQFLWDVFTEKDLHYLVIFLLGLSMIFDDMLLNPANVVLGQPDAQQFIVSTPRSPCQLEVYSSIITADDSSTTASLFAFPPSPCTSLNLEIMSLPEETANCTETELRGGGMQVNCEFTTEHEATTFYFDPIAR